MLAMKQCMAIVIMSIFMLIHLNPVTAPEWQPLTDDMDDGSSFPASWQPLVLQSFVQLSVIVVALLSMHAVELLIDCSSDGRHGKAIVQS